MSRFAAALFPLAVSAACSPALADFTRMDFKYTSLAYLEFAGSNVDVPIGVPETVDMIGTFLRQGQASISDIKEMHVRFVQSQADRTCEAWVHGIYRAEWAAYDRNKFSEYKKIDRTAPPECQLPKPHWIQYGYSVETMPAEAGESFQITAVIDRTITHTTSGVRPIFSSLFGGMSGNILSTVPSNVTSTIPFSTDLTLFVWRAKGETMTHVFAVGSPRSGTVSAGPQAGVGYDFRSVADGRIEAQAVRNVLSFLKQKALLQSAKGSVGTSQVGGPNLP